MARPRRRHQMHVPGHFPVKRERLQLLRDGSRDAVAAAPPIRAAADGGVPGSAGELLDRHGIHDDRLERMAPWPWEKAQGENTPSPAIEG